MRLPIGVATMYRPGWRGFAMSTGVVMAEAVARRQPRTAVTRWLALLAAGALAACSTLVPKGPVESADQRPSAGPQAARPDNDVQAGIPRDTQRNRIALLVPLSGSNAGVGQSIANAANLALLDAGGERIRITVYDTASGGAAAAANQALADGNLLFLGPLLAEDVRACLGAAVFDTVVPRNVRLSEAPSHGLPALIYDLKCPGSEAYVRLAREIIGRLPQLSAAEAA